MSRLLLIACKVLLKPSGHTANIRTFATPESPDPTHIQSTTSDIIMWGYRGLARGCAVFISQPTTSHAPQLSCTPRMKKAWTRNARVGPVPLEVRDLEELLRWRYQVRPEFMCVRGTLGSVAYVDSKAGMAWRRNSLRPLLIGKKIANSPPGLGRNFAATGVDSEFTPRSKAWTQNGLHPDSIWIDVHVTVRGNLF
ncbi:hypothetical protein B0H10DRAFT_1952379 [Mycena sp. CBHHK59/15]|nr:hypothetical protein B0H10DRAFT_1952379 [Mycena sp. CBHHK59/15]